MLKRISTVDAVFIVLMAACGLVLKPIIGPLTKLIGSALFLSSASFAGTIYFLFPMLALLVVRQFGSVTLTGLIQGINNGRVKIKAAYPLRFVDYFLIALVIIINVLGIVQIWT